MTTRKRYVWAAVRFAVGIGLVVYLTTSGALDWSVIPLLAVRWELTGGALLVLGASLVVTASRLCILLRPRGFELPLTGSIRLTLIGLFFNSYLPGSSGGDAVKIYFAAAGNEGARTELVTVMVLDRGMGLIGLLVWLFLAAPLFPELFGDLPVARLLLAIGGGTALLVFTVYLALTSSRVRTSAFIASVLERLPGGAYLKRIGGTLSKYRSDPGVLLAALGISVVAHTLTVTATLLAAQAVLSGGAKWPMALLVPLGLLANAIPATPGGLGVGEAALEGLFGLAGYSGGAEVLLSWRILTLALGLGGLPLYLAGRRRVVFETE